MKADFDPHALTREQVEAIVNKTYAGIALFARDTNLPPAFAKKYVPGRIVREKAFTDASIRFMGMVTTHRFVILSNHMAEPGAIPGQPAPQPNWGLHIAGRNARFMVLGQHVHQGKTGIFLLHLPDDPSWKLWLTTQFDSDEQLYAMAVERFVNKCTAPPAPELTTPEWLDRCAFPVGMSDDGQFWPLEDEPAAAPAAPAAPAGEAPGQPDAARILRSRYEGCLLGGAVGDALGYPVEFMKETAIRAKYGPQGIQTLAQAGRPALISDDTQMTLFAANAIVCREQTGGHLTKSLWTAYREWLGTQGDTSRMDDPERPKMWVYREPRMHALRAPGNTCLSAIRNSPHGGTIQHPVNGSKGCGSVMRAAPFGLAVNAKGAFGDGGASVCKMAAEDAALTHGHPMARASSAALARMIFNIAAQQHHGRNCRLQEVVPLPVFKIDPAVNSRLQTLLQQAVQLAQDKKVSDLDGIHALGEGWVAEEALAIAVFCAVRYQDDFAAAIRAAVNHGGDSDSTGAICGNILGAWLGREAVEAAFDLNDLELREVIVKMADQLYDAVNAPARPAPPAQPKPAPAPLKPLRPVGLMYTPLTKKALRICFDAHGGQADKSGLPYVIHPLHLAEQMETEYEVCAALLHDAVEDGGCALEDLRKAGMPNEVVEAVRCLTRTRQARYLDYIAALRKNPIACRVKLADLAHNSDLNRLDNVTGQDRRRVLKYRMAQAVLQSDRYDPVLKHFRKRIPLSLDQPLYLSVFYDITGSVEKYSIDIEKAEDSHYELDPHQAEKLRLALAPGRTLPEALADWAQAGGGLAQVESLLGQLGIDFKAEHFYG